MRARLADVAKLANVHPATASRALNERTRSRVSPETLDRVMQAADALNYLPNTMARSLASARSSTIGVVIGDLTVPLFAHLIRGIDDVTSAAGYTALIVNTDNDAEREFIHLRSLEARRVDGLIVTTSTLDDPSGCRRFTRVAPVVNLLRASGDPCVPQVISNDALGMQLAMEHLFSLGHSRIGHVAGPQNISTALARLRAYRDAMLERGLGFDPDLVVTIDRIDTDEGRRAAAELLDRSDCTAIVGFNDSVTFGLLKELRARGIHCPTDISVVGYSDIPAAELVAPALTTVSVDHYAMGAEAARMLLEILANPEQHVARSVQLPVHLVIRETTCAVNVERSAAPSTRSSVG